MTEKDFKQIFPLGEKNDAYPEVSVFYVSQFILYPNIHFDTHRRTLLWMS